MAVVNKKRYLIGIGIALVVGWVVPVFYEGKELSYQDLMVTIPVVVSLIGGTSGKKENKLVKTSPFRLTSSFESGVYGGLIGGIIAGLTLAITYYISSVGVWDNRQKLIFESIKIIPFGAIVGSLFGGVIQLGISFFRTLPYQTKFSTFLGSFFGCILSGTLSGALGMWVFGNNPAKFVGYEFIAFGSVIAIMALILGALTYDYEGKKRYVLRSMIIAIVITTFAVMLGYLIMGTSMIDGYLDEKVNSHKMSDMIQGGLVLGAVVGIVVGLAIGLTISFFKYWRYAESQQESYEQQLNAPVET